MPSSSSVNTVNLARESTRWSQADSAGRYTMRYITAMRNYLIETWGAGDAIDGSLELLLNHLSNKGFGEGGKGKLRDYLLRSTRAAVATYHSKNAWAHIQGVGWRKCKPSNPENVTAMFTACCEARANTKTVTVLASSSELEQIYL